MTEIAHGQAPEDIRKQNTQGRSTIEANPDSGDPEELRSTEEAQPVKEKQDNTPLEFAPEQLAAIEAGNNLDALLSLRQDVNEADQEAYIQCCRDVFRKDFQDKKPQSLEEVDAQFARFLVAVTRLTNIRESIAPRLLSLDSKPTAEQEKVISALAILVSERLPLPVISGQISPEEEMWLFESVDQQQVAAILQEINVQFVGQLPNEQFVSIRENDGAVLIAPTQSNVRGFDLLSLKRQIETARTVEEDTGFDDQDQDLVSVENQDAIGYFRERGVSQEDLGCYRRYRHQEAFALASLYRDYRENPQSGGAPKSVVGDFLALEEHRRKTPDEDFTISEANRIAYKGQLDVYRSQWGKIKNTGIDVNTLDLEAIFDFEGDSSGGAENASLPESSGKSGDLEKKGKSGIAGDKTRAEGKNAGPKNVKEAVMNMFKVFNDDIISQLDPIGAIIGNKAA